MRKKFICGNWKMNLLLSESVFLAKAITSYSANKTCDIGIAPNFTAIHSVSEAIKGSPVLLGAQNVYCEKNGAFTGEVSLEMLLSVGCHFVIIGHSERRQFFGDTNTLINKKILASLLVLQKVIFCIGETLQEREENRMKTVLETQLREGLKSVVVQDPNKLVVAYEPVWAIGTGKTASPAQAEEAHYFIRTVLANIFSKEIAEKIVIQYGGSVKGSNAKELLSMPNIDGALVGGASLVADEFEKIIVAIS